jgi:hypothetical protein
VELGIRTSDLLLAARRVLAVSLLYPLAAAAGVICLSYGVYSWAAFFLVLAALNLAGGYWYLTIARSASA